MTKRKGLCKALLTFYLNIRILNIGMDLEDLMTILNNSENN